MKTGVERCLEGVSFGFRYHDGERNFQRQNLPDLYIVLLLFFDVRMECLFKKVKKVSYYPNILSPVRVFRE